MNEALVLIQGINQGMHGINESLLIFLVIMAGITSLASVIYCGYLTVRMIRWFWFRLKMWSSATEQTEQTAISTKNESCEGNTGLRMAMATDSHGKAFNAGDVVCYVSADDAGFPCLRVGRVTSLSDPFHYQVESDHYYNELGPVFVFHEERLINSKDLFPLPSDYLGEVKEEDVIVYEIPGETYFPEIGTILEINNEDGTYLMKKQDGNEEWIEQKRLVQVLNVEWEDGPYWSKDVQANAHIMFENPKYRKIITALQEDGMSDLDVLAMVGGILIARCVTEGKTVEDILKAAN